ncbi:MAG TPA: DOMON-like domain-containing protein [Rhizomicrobium sp.]|nr:DOMON-like domain-containing protein [Rhizomicrobium sp.]
MRLLPHAHSDAVPVRGIAIEAARHGAMLALRYLVAGDIRRVRLPGEGFSERTNGLWQRTCCEAFVRSSRSPAYWEFNFSPSRQWAAYSFERYREGMTPEPAVSDPRIGLQSDDGKFVLSASLDLSGIAALRGSEDWQLGLSAIVEDRDGNKSYWALAHPSGKPDFHHLESFVLVLSPHSAA